ncbi:hypothetical protein [Pseudoalteromonas sp. NCIMB_1079]|uniref:hypothetical protein n=1 Tax=Pseudoalteromonas sp. NCIMB 1079 TaxID=3142847 RepID=UPI00339C8A14
MKIRVGFIICSLILSSNAMANGNPDFTAFALKQANSKGFYGCDTAIKTTFQFASGTDIRVFTDQFDETKSDSLKLTGIYGSKGDTVYLEAEYRVKDSKCYVTKTSMITSLKSCTAYASEMKEFNFVAETGDYIVLQNKGKVPMFLKPLATSCVVTFQNTLTF